jgi:hypothetical protein
MLQTSGTGSLLSLWRAAGLQAFHDGGTDFRSATAAIVQQEQCDLLKRAEIGAIHDRSAVSFGSDESRPRQDREVGRQRVLRHLEQARQFARRETIGPVANQSPECFEAGRLRQGSQRHDGLFSFHISRFMEMTWMSQSETRRIDPYFEYSRNTVDALADCAMLVA